MRPIFREVGGVNKCWATLHFNRCLLAPGPIWPLPKGVHLTGTPPPPCPPFLPPPYPPLLPLLLVPLVTCGPQSPSGGAPLGQSTAFRSRRGGERGSRGWEQRPYTIETMQSYVHYLCNAYLGCTYPCWQVALQSVAIAYTLGWLARPLVAEISCALRVHYRFSAECTVSLII